MLRKRKFETLFFDIRKDVVAFFTTDAAIPKDFFSYLKSPTIDLDDLTRLLTIAINREQFILVYDIYSRTPRLQRYLKTSQTERAKDFIAATISSKNLFNKVAIDILKNNNFLLEYVFTDKTLAKEGFFGYLACIPVKHLKLFLCPIGYMGYTLHHVTIDKFNELIPLLSLNRNKYKLYLLINSIERIEILEALFNAKNIKRNYSIRPAIDDRIRLLKKLHPKWQVCLESKDAKLIIDFLDKHIKDIPATLYYDLQSLFDTSSAEHVQMIKTHVVRRGYFNYQPYKPSIMVVAPRPAAAEAEPVPVTVPVRNFPVPFVSQMTNSHFNVELYLQTLRNPKASRDAIDEFRYNVETQQLILGNVPLLRELFFSCLTMGENGLAQALWINNPILQTNVLIEISDDDIYKIIHFGHGLDPKIISEIFAPQTIATRWIQAQTTLSILNTLYDLILNNQTTSMHVAVLLTAINNELILHTALQLYPDDQREGVKYFKFQVTQRLQQLQLNRHKDLIQDISKRAVSNSLKS